MSAPVIQLRPCEPEDLELLYSIENDPTLWNTSNSEGPYSRYAIKHYIASAQPIHACGELRLVIEVTLSEGNREAIGLIDLTNYSALSARAEVGIALLKNYRGKGYAQQALALLEDFAINRLRIHLLYALVTPENFPSLKLFEKADFQQIAVLPSWHYAQASYRDIIVLAKFF